MMDAPRPQRKEESAPGRRVLLCEVGTLVCGLPLEFVVETLRALPVQPIQGTLSFVRGVSIIRGSPVPIVDLAVLFGMNGVAPRPRLVLLKVENRRVALAVSLVRGIHTLAARALHALPPLLGGAQSEFVSALSSLDSRLLLVLESGRVVPESSWAELQLLGANA